MKPGFGNKKNKKKNKNKNKKNKQEADKDATVHMDDVSDDGNIDYTIPADTSVTAELSAKDKHKKQMHLKRSLKVKVAHLKQQRGKLTKLPGNKPQRKELSAAIKQLVVEQKPKQKGAKPAAAGAAGGASGSGAAAMVE